MQKIWIVFEHEFISVVARKSFILTLILIPLVSSLLYLVAGKINQGNNSENSALVEMISPKESTLPDGLVDASGIVAYIPEDLTDNLVQYSDEQSAAAALDQGMINAYYLVSADYLTTGQVEAYQKDYNVMSGLESSWMLEDTLRSNLLQIAQIPQSLYDDPLPDLAVNISKITVVEQPQQRDPDHALSFVIPYVVSLLFYIIIISTSSMLMNSITTEKENRVMEILLTSMDPETMLMGKILSRGVVGFLQFIFWGGTGWLLLRGGGQAFQIPQEFQIPASFLIWGLVYLLLGYFLYAVLMASVGALAPNMRESSQVTILFVFPMVIPLMFVSVFSQTPNAAIPVFLSYFPLTSPIAMMMRLSVTVVPFWSLLLSAAILGGCAYLCLRLLGGLFRADVLLSSGSLNIKRFFKAVFQQARA
jgi:ABC-2 type transport system permease protein